MPVAPTAVMDFGMPKKLWTWSASWTCRSRSAPPDRAPSMNQFCHALPSTDGEIRLNVADFIFPALPLL